MVDISDMLFIVGHVGHIWRSWETKLYETITRSKVFEVQSFREQIFLGRYWDFFLDQNFWDWYRDFFLRPKFSRPILRLFSRLNIFETNTETFFRDQNFWDREQYSQKIEKSLHTEKSWDEMSHSGWKPPEVVSFSVKNISRFSNKLKYNYKPIPVKTPILGLTPNSPQVTPN